ncbi:ABC transporter ATP-binding protein [Deinococcus aetherius]|nr:ABC transporter ATP-binding protein [Deinococcus aetherius]
MNGLSVRGLCKGYAGRAVLRGVSLDVPAGERFALLGPSGSGKTTLLRIVAGLDHPDAGEVQIGGVSLAGVPAERRGLGVVFQDPLLFPHLTVGENVGFSLRLRGERGRALRARVEEVLEQVGLSGYAARRPHGLSGGQAQRVALARALVTRPRVLLLDEPFSALDTPLRRELRGWLTALQEATGTTMLFVTHDQEEALNVGQRIGLLLDGTLAQVGEGQAFYTRPASVTVAAFFGGVNFIPGEQRGGEVRTELGVFRVPVRREGRVTLTVRPEALRLADEENAVRGEVVASEFAGTHRRVTLRAGLQRLVWHAPPHEAVTVGQPLTLACPASACWTIPAG